MNIYQSCEVVFSLEEKSENGIYSIWKKHYPHQKYYIERSSYSLSIEKKVICNYNPRCFMSNGLMFDDIITYMIKNKELEYHKEGVDNFLTNIDNNNIYICTGVTS